MISITTESGAVFTAPDSLEEITQEKLFLLVLEHQRLILGDRKAGLVEAEKHHRLGLIYHLFKINYWDWVDLPETDQQKFLVATSWIDQARVKQLPFSHFDFQGVRYYVPKPGYADSCAVEVALSNIWYVSFAHPKQPNTEAFFHLLATMYRPAAHPSKRWFEFWKPRPGAVRKEYASDDSEARAQVFKNLPFALAMALLQYWEHENGEFLKRYRDLFDSEDDDQSAPLFAGGEGWISCLEEVAETSAYGTTEKVFLENVHTIFGFLRRKQIKVRKMEESPEDFE